VTRADWFRSNDDRIGDLIASNTDCFPLLDWVYYYVLRLSSRNLISSNHLLVFSPETVNITLMAVGILKAAF